MADASTKFDDLDVLDQIRHVQDLWDRIAANPDRVPLTDEQRAELERRREAAKADPDAAIPWDEVKQRLRDSR